MISGHGPNPIFFNKKIKIRRPEHLQSPTPLRPITSHLYLPLRLKVDFIYVSLLMIWLKSN